MYYLHIYGIIGAGGVGRRGDLMVTCGNVSNGVFLVIICVLLLTCSTSYFYWFFMALNGLESSVGNFLMVLEVLLVMLLIVLATVLEGVFLHLPCP